MPDHDGAGGRYLVEGAPIDAAVPYRVVPEGEQRLAGWQVGLDLDQPGEELLPVPHGWNVLPRELPPRRRHELHGQQHGGHGGMQVGVDEPRHDAVVPERVVYLVAPGIQPRTQRLERPYFDNATVPHRNRVRHRQGPFHRPHRSSQEYGYLSHVILPMPGRHSRIEFAVLQRAPETGRDPLPSASSRAPFVRGG